MGKNDFLMPKAITNQANAKRLQKLRWYCQSCQKQCRDENGFKCHCMSEGHQRQMEIFGQNPDRIVDGYSEEFETSFLEHIKRTHRFSRVAATVVYNEYIADRHHVHMNSTKWITLTEFVKYLDQTGKCNVEETRKGLFITYIDRDSETLFKKGLKNKRYRSSGHSEEDKQERMIRRQIERVEQLMPAANGEEEQTQPYEELVIPKTEPAAGGKIAFSLAISSKRHAKKNVETTKVVFEEVETEKMDKKNKKKLITNVNSVKGGASGYTLDKLMKEHEEANERRNRKDYWLCEGIVVKVMSNALAQKGYYKQKGLVMKVIDKYVGELEMLDTRHVLRVDQEELETVIPNIGGLVRILNGTYRGLNARLMSVDIDNYCAKLKIEKGIYDGRILQDIDYEDICAIMP